MMSIDSCSLYHILSECDNTSKLQSNIYMMCYSVLTLSDVDIFIK